MKLVFIVPLNTLQPWRFTPSLLPAHHIRPPTVLCLPKPPPHPPERPARSYAAFAGLLALLIPAAVCLLNLGNAAVLSAVGPHLYLTSAQVVCEFFTGGGTTAALPRMLVPIGFNAYRMWVLWAWCGAAVAAGLGPLHLGLALANLGFWGYNLLGFLLLKMLPMYLDPRKCAI